MHNSKNLRYFEVLLRFQQSYNLFRSIMVLLQYCNICPVVVPIGFRSLGSHVECMFADICGKGVLSSVPLIPSLIDFLIL